MARPRKNNAEYFSHDVSMRNNKKIKAVRAKYGLVGYAIWNMFLETLTESENFEAEFDELDVELLAGDYGLDLKQLQEILDYFVYVKLLLVSVTETTVSATEIKITKKYWSDELKKRLRGVVEKRDKAREKADYGNRNYAKPDISVTETPVFATETSQSVTETPQKKVKESKVNKKKEDIYTTLPEQIEPFKNSYAPNLIENFLLYWDETDHKNIPRWKKEKTWDVKKRLERWKKQNDEWAYERSQKQQLKKVEEIPKQENSKIEQIDTGFQKINFNKFN